MYHSPLHIPKASAQHGARLAVDEIASTILMVAIAALSLAVVISWLWGNRSTGGDEVRAWTEETESDSSIHSSRGYKTPKNQSHSHGGGAACASAWDDEEEEEGVEQRYPEYSGMQVLIMALSSMTDKQLEARASRKNLSEVRDKADRIAAVLRTGVARAEKWRRKGRDPMLVSTFCDEGMTESAARFAMGLHPGEAQREWTLLLELHGASSPPTRPHDESPASSDSVDVSPKDLFGAGIKGAEGSSTGRHRRKVRLDFEAGSKALCPALHKILRSSDESGLREVLGEVEARRCSSKSDAITSLLRLARTRARLGLDLGDIPLGGGMTVKGTLEGAGGDVEREWQDLCAAGHCAEKRPRLSASR